MVFSGFLFFIDLLQGKPLASKSLYMVGDALGDMPCINMSKAQLRHTHVIDPCHPALTSNPTTQAMRQVAA